MKRLLKRMKAEWRACFHRDNVGLIKELVRAKFAVMDYNSVFGVLWSLINPLVLTAILYFIFRERFGSSIKAYPLYVLSGSVLIGYFLTTTGLMLPLLSDNRELVINTMIRRENLFITVFVIQTYKLFIEIVVCFMVAVFYHVLRWQAVIPLLTVVLCFALLTLSAGMFLSLFYCVVRDVRHIWGLIGRVLLFLTPVFYVRSSLSRWASWLVYCCNPLTPFVESFHAMLRGESGIRVWLTYGHSIVLTAVFCLSAYGCFVIFHTVALERS